MSYEIWDQNNKQNKKENSERVQKESEVKSGLSQCSVCSSTRVV